MISVPDGTPIPRKVRVKTWGRVRVTLNYDYTRKGRAFAVGFRLFPSAPKGPWMGLAAYNRDEGTS